MQVVKWVNSLAVRFPVQLVADLHLKKAEKVDLHFVGERHFEVSKKPIPPELVALLSQLRGRFVTDFYLNRLEANVEAL